MASAAVTAYNGVGRKKTARISIARQLASGIQWRASWRAISNGADGGHYRAKRQKRREMKIISGDSGAGARASAAVWQRAGGGR